MDFCVLQGPALKAVGGEQNRFLGVGCAFLVREYLHIVSLDRPSVILALDENKKVNVERSEPRGYVDLVPPVWRLDHLTMFHAKIREALTSLAEQIDSQPLKFRAVDSRTVIAGRSNHIVSSA
jgi:hypothetical protein